MGKSISAKKLVSTINMSKEDWLEHRFKGLGSSDIATAIGINPYKGQYELWLEKTRQVVSRPDPEALERMEMGTKIEGFIAGLFEERNEDLSVTLSPVIWQHPICGWALANIDRQLFNADDNSYGILEIKNVSEYTGAGEDWKDKIPDYYMCQVQHQLFVLGLDWAYLACLWGGNKYRQFEIARDDDLIADIEKTGGIFWNMVEGMIAPNPTHTATKLLSQVYPLATPDAKVDLDSHDTIVTEFQASKQLAELSEKRHESAKNNIKLLMSEAGFGMYQGKKAFSWTNQQGRISFDTDRFKEDHPELYEQYLKQGNQTRVFRSYKF